MYISKKNQAILDTFGTEKEKQDYLAELREVCYKWRKTNPEKFRESGVKWRKANPEKVKEGIVKWQKENPEKAKKIWARTYQKRRAKKLEAEKQLI
jgi:hypothetical protein